MELVEAKIKLLSKIFFLVILEADLVDINNAIYLKQLLFLEIKCYKIKYVI